MKNTVIAMTYEKEPIVRTVVGSGERVVYLTADTDELSDAVSRVAVGFPNEFVFEHDGALFEKLERAYRDANQNALSSLWQSAQKWRP